MEDDQKQLNIRQPQKIKWKTNQSTKINLIGCDTIVNSPSSYSDSYTYSSSTESSFNTSETANSTSTNSSGYDYGSYNYNYGCYSVLSGSDSDSIARLGERFVQINTDFTVLFAGMRLILTIYA